MAGKVNISLANKNIRAKIFAKKLALAKSSAHCKGALRPSVVRTGNNVRVVCKPVNIEKSRQTKLMIKKIKKTKRYIIGKRKASATKKFRSM